MRFKEITFIDDKYINLFIVYLKHIQFISTITYTGFMYDCKICITLSLLVIY